MSVHQPFGYVGTVNDRLVAAATITLVPKIDVDTICPSFITHDFQVLIFTIDCATIWGRLLCKLRLLTGHIRY